MYDTNLFILFKYTHAYTKILRKGINKMIIYLWTAINKRFERSKESRFGDVLMISAKLF